MLIDLDFAPICCIFVLPKRREPLAPWFSPLFLAKMPRKKGFSTSEVEKFLSEVEKFFSNVRFFLSEVGEKNAETVPRNVKENLFAKVHF